MKGYYVEISAIARVRVQVFVQANSPEQAKEAALGRIAQGNVDHKEWHFEGQDEQHEVLKIRGA